MSNPIKKRLNSVLGYVADDNGEFSLESFSRVDSAVLSLFSCFQWNISPKIDNYLNKLQNAPKLIDLYDETLFPAIFSFKENYECDEALFILACASKRWQNVRIIFHQKIFDENISEQFSGTAYLLTSIDDCTDSGADKSRARCVPDYKRSGSADSENNNTNNNFIGQSFIYVGFAGTDASLAGWKEDFMLAYCEEIPSQSHAVTFLQKILESTDLPVIVGGYSKGGNLAMYASAKCDCANNERIFKVFSHDNPGFSLITYQNAQINSLSNKLDRTLPVNTTVGAILNNPSEYLIVRSAAHMFWQHNAYTWIVENRDFIYAKDTSNWSKAFANIMDRWLSQLTFEQMSAFTETVFSIIGAGEIKDFTSIDFAARRAQLLEIIRLDPSVYKMILVLAARLAGSSISATAALLNKKLFFQK